ncbi:PREDICTED: uncharacterized protein LOC109589130 [Amphimedon queenslandica]|uniref:Uncharacterized protein n=2 Tax=Amphimedon queenslandica TaxID=400682 RepID=A0AAN0JV80_AMPQE|nr:PREDICTED: uncharacterized protein LOC109589130 [Amphimedon queenslandica]|eukprot:XP_019860807.1 PREDICTED: uncharacterized protein LOC109589130 [Amphimedon queenslandica]
MCQTNSIDCGVLTCLNAAFQVGMRPKHILPISGTQMVRQWILNEIGKSISSGLLGENITCEENMEIMKKEIAATQYIYTENDETFDTCDDLSKDEDTDSDTQSSDIDADELNRQFSNIGSMDISEVLIPDYVNSPPPVKDTEEILYGISSHWGKQYFLDHYPIIDRTKSDEYVILYSI